MEPAVEDVAASEAVGQGEDALLELSLGPHHPSTHGVFRMDVVLDGERVMKLKPVFGVSAPEPRKDCRGCVVPGVDAVYG